MPSIVSSPTTVASATMNPVFASASNYFSYPESGGLMLAHIALMTLGWVFVLPVAIVLNIAHSSFTLPVQLSFLGLHGIATLLGTIYKYKTPQLYQHNSHGPIGWIVTWIVVAQTVLAIFKLAAGLRSRPTSDKNEQEALLRMTSQALKQHEEEQPATSYQHRFSGEDGPFTTPEQSRSQSVSSTATYTQEEQQRLHEYEADHAAFTQHAGKEGLPDSKRVERVATAIAGKLSNPMLRFVDLASNFIDRAILVIGFIAFVSGAAVYGGVFRGNSIFNGLAHAIKGGIFFWYGLLTLGRWTGCFSEYGWAWNVKPPAGVVGSWKARVPSAEFVESFVIFFYGFSNVFLEHLAAWGKEWSPMDLEHISITIMFFGGGFCGMLIESTRIRDLLNAVMLTSPAAHGPQQIQESLKPPKTYPVSMNPLPALVIMLLGVMMSSHHQHSTVSTMVHKQWGTLLVGFALARGLTYLLTYLSPPTSYLPSRPPTELISSFCLISGGIIFMASNRDTVNSMDEHGIHAMFPFAVTMGFTSFLMAWAIIVLAVKGWAVQRTPHYFHGRFHRLNIIKTNMTTPDFNS
ncbi:uncharacterized protein KY384_005828 [Bacidia gigantensis]|uniref:uncharacterized protein n=1 Tax=Bacidia gigantensis TaxID=2732470 RepID=UPI001D04D36D|nr:uncharacterized protein KY384_005828 [Bacidia gigantensis]KAG8529193.1 hypothetical protein KY384_005828 [Bacidia gigantensis]